MDVQLNFIDQSQKIAPVDVAIFQRDEAEDFENRSVAWKVIHNTTKFSNHPFNVPDRCEVAVRDSWGNFLPRLKAAPGQLFLIRQTPAGSQLMYAGKATCRDEIQIQNALASGTIDATLFRDGRLLAIKTRIGPSQKAVFRLRPVIYVTAAQELREGEPLDPDLVANSTELALEDIARADIVMRSDGERAQGPPFTFELVNVEP